MAADERDCPTLRPLGAPDEAALAVLKRSARLRVVGGAAPLLALRALVEVLAPEARITWQSEAGAVDGEGLVCIEGPAWVDEVAEEAARAKLRVVMAGAGSHEPPPKGAWVDDARAGDGRFVGFGPTAATVLAWAGVDPAAWAAGLAEGQGSCLRTALFDNVAWSVAAALSLRPDAIPVLVATSGALAPLTRSLARTWSATVRGMPAGPGPNVRVGLTVLDGVADDGLTFEALHGAPTDRVPVLIGPPTDASQTMIGWLTREGRPYLTLRAARTPQSIATLLTLGTHAAVALAVLRHLDPLAAPGAEAWDRTVERLRAVDDASTLA